jgi:ankyrin repeat protein
MTSQTRNPSAMPGLACIPSSLMSIACVLKDLRILNLAIKLHGKTSTQRRQYADEINQSNRHGHFLLHYAVGHTHIAFSGLTFGESSDGIYVSNKMILGLETINDEVDATFFHALTDRGADINACDTDGRTPLHWAALGNYKSMLNLLVNKGANVHAVTKSYSTALHCAARAGSVFMVQKLL